MGRYGGTLEPAEFSMVQAVFKRIARDAWFREDIPTLNRFGRVVLSAYQSGIVDGTMLYEHCITAANERFSEAKRQAFDE